MGRFVNPDNRAFQAALNSKIYVDKTGLLEYTNSVLNSTAGRGDLESLLRQICSRHITAKHVTLVKCFQIWKSATAQISWSI